MRIELPILVIAKSAGDQTRAVHAVRPLFFEQPEASHRSLSQALSSLGGMLNEHLSGLGRGGHHAELADYTFFPELKLHRLTLRLDLRPAPFRGSFPIVTFRQLSRTLAFSPLLLDTWFEVRPDETLAYRAEQVYTRYFRDLAKRVHKDEVQHWLERFAENSTGTIRIVPLTLHVDTGQRFERESASDLVSLAGPSAGRGRQELRSVGRCLDEHYPDRLQRAYYRDTDVDELTRRLAVPDRQPLLIVGPSLVGKTALIHEFVYRQTQRRLAESPHVQEPSGVWLLAPQRLIAGMAYVGQWEQRLLSIIQAAQKWDHTLYFDDVLGLYRAGVTCQSELSVADVLRPYLERREVRVVAEITPEQLRLFRERDRGLADQFHVLHVEPPKEDELLLMLLQVIRELEAQCDMQFAPDALPAVLDYTRRYQRSDAYPGKAIRWLQQLAAKAEPGSSIAREEALAEIRASNGLQMSLLDSHESLARRDVAHALDAHVIGQGAAVEALADVVSVAKARVNDPGRPLASLLFVGPTGVGKTESAKALAKYLFGDVARLLRFDMNEFISPDAVARLVGTFMQPEGLLTAAIRRQPFSVVLFDEIEKAYPQVFDLMLQILGEARLTDAQGRTVDFGNAVLILTSNLGTREAAHEIGFVDGAAGTEAPYLRAVREFFRPEFFNRLDRVVPFAPLDRDSLEQIAQRVVQDVTARDGLLRRRCAMDLQHEAAAWVVEQGYDPLLGARAMKRAVETEIVQPLARHLAAISPDTPTVLSIARQGDRLAVDVTPLLETPRWTEAARPVVEGEIQPWLDRARAALARIERQCLSRRPAGELSAGRISAEHATYLGMIELARDLRDCEPLTERRVQGADWYTAVSPRFATSSMRGSLKQLTFGWRHARLNPVRQLLREFYAAEDIAAFLRDLAMPQNSAATQTEPAESLHTAFDRLALLEMLSAGDGTWESERALVLVRSLHHGACLRPCVRAFVRDSVSFAVGNARAETGGQQRDQSQFEFGVTCQYPEECPYPEERLDRRDVMLCEGYRAAKLLQLQQGTHLFVFHTGQIAPVQVIVVPMSPADDATQVLARSTIATRASEAIEERCAAVPPVGPRGWQPVVALWQVIDHPDLLRPVPPGTPTHERHGGRLVADLRSGWVARAGNRSHTWHGLGGLLPLPRELREE